MALLLLILPSLLRPSLAQDASSCYLPQQSPYLNEPSPFGWPLTPNDWSYADLSTWSEKYMMCNGEKQSPIDIALSSPTCPVQNFGSSGALKQASSYQAGQRTDVIISKYLRTAYVQSNFGSITLKDGAGNDLPYDAVQVHITSPSLHTVDGQQYDAEMLVFHQPRGQGNMLASAVVVSVLLKAGGQSSVFSDMGFTDDDAPVNAGSRWYAPRFVDLPQAFGSALAGDSFLYNGSVPVPPCTENVKYFVMKDVQSVSASQVKKLQDTLNCFAGGNKKRGPRPNPFLNKCRNIYANNIRVGGSHVDDTCQVAWKNDTWQLSADCWDMGLSSADRERCAKETIDVDGGEARSRQKDEKVGSISSTLQPASFVKVTPNPRKLTVTAIDYERPNSLGHFGQLSINGRIFFAREISIKAISSHSYSGGKYYAGEIRIEHLLFGDEFDFNATGDLGLDEARRLRAQTPRAARRTASTSDFWSNTSVANQMHRVIMSIPLVIGKENVLLRSLGLSGGFEGAIRDGLSYQVSNVDVQSGLKGSLDGSWVWYSGGPVGPGCPEWGVRWMMFEEPTEVSFDQLNHLLLKISGVDSVRTNQPYIPDEDYKKHVFKQYVPTFAVDTHESCGKDDDWGYGDVSCWAQKYPACNGLKQSPIDLRDEDVKGVGEETFLDRVSWKPVSHLSVLNTGHSMQITNGQLGYVTLIGPDGFPMYFTTAQLHLHMPSEHMINGRQFAAELQVIHNRQKHVTQKANSLDSFPLVVTSFMFDISDVDEESPFLKQFGLSDGTIGSNEAKETDDPVDLMRSFGPALEGKFYRYDGSVTIPDCHEQVKWFVFDHVFNMSRLQWQNFNKVYANPANNRPVQPLNGRKVTVNSFEEGTLVHYDFYGARNRGRNAPKLGKGWVIFPIVGALLLMAAVMIALFVREGKRKLQSAGGLTETIGRGQYNQL